MSEKLSVKIFASFYCSYIGYLGWNSYKKRKNILYLELGDEKYSYGFRNTESDTGLQVLSYFPAIFILGIPFICGIWIAHEHDKLLYKMYPIYYQEKIDMYRRRKKELHKQYAIKYPTRYQGTGISQITYW